MRIAPYWVRSPDGPFAVLLASIAAGYGTRGDDESRAQLRAAVRSGLLEGSAVLRAELGAAVLDPELLPEGGLADAAGEAGSRDSLLLDMWRDLYDGRPQDAGGPGEFRGLLAWIEEARAARRASPAVAGFAAEPACAECGTAAARVELTAPGHVPVRYPSWGAARQALFLLSHDFARWHLIATGVAGGNGDGDDVGRARAAILLAAFRRPLCYSRVRTAALGDDAGFCGECGDPWCRVHWHVTESGFGRCPRGHGKRMHPQSAADW
jgi:hypothetical protein